MKLAERILDGTDYIIRSVGDWLSRDPRRDLDPYTVDGDAIVCKDGSLYSVIQLKGYGSLVGNEEFSRLVGSWEEVLSARMKSDAIHELIVCFEAEEPGEILDDNFAPAVAQSKRMGLDVEDIFDEKKRRYRELCLEERCYLVIYTVPHLLAREENKAMRGEVAEKLKDHPPANNGQYYDVVASLIRDRHTEVVASIAGFLASNSYLYYQIDPASAMRILRRQLLGHDLSARWNPIFTTTAYTPQQIDPLNPGDMSVLLPKPLSQQLLDDEPEIIGRNFVAIGDRIVAPVRITQMPTKSTSFDTLISLLRSADIPYRIAFNLKPNGLLTNRFDASISEWGAWASAANAQINEVYKGLRAYETETNIPCIAFSATACTWVKLDASWKVTAKGGGVTINLADIKKRVQALINRLNDWGSVQADNALANPMTALLSTTAGGRRKVYSPVTPAPLNGAIALLPITRPGLPWHQGTMLFRTKDGSILPYEQYSQLQSYWITLISGPMGYGKSSQIASQNFAFLTQPADSPNLPILRGMDIGPSQRPVVDLIRDALPHDRKHEAIFLRFKNDKNFGANPFDTMLGTRYPTSNHRTYLINLVVTLASTIDSWPSLTGLAATLVDTVFKRCDDANYNATSKRYTPGASPEVDRLIERYSLEVVPRKSTWWSIVDMLFNLGEIRGAKLAQRFAVPVMSDLDAAAQSADVLSEYPDSQSSGLRYVDLFSRCVRDTAKLFPFLVMPTQLDLSDSPIVVIDMEGVIQRSDSPSVQQQNAIYFMVIFRMLTGDYFLDESLLNEVNPAYKTHHQKHIEYLKACKKRFFGDETHRYAVIPGARAQLDQIGVEARKFFIDLLLGSQMILDHSEKLRQLASTTIMCGAGGPGDVDEIARTYGLTPKAKDALSRIKMPGKDGAQVLMMIDNKQVRRQVLDLINTEGPRFLWAIATNAADRYVRDMLTRELGDSRLARTVLAAHYPGGEIRSEQARRQRNLGGELEDVSVNILNEIVSELKASAENSRLQPVLDIAAEKAG